MTKFEQMVPKRIYNSPITAMGCRQCLPQYYQKYPKIHNWFGWSAQMSKIFGILKKCHWLFVVRDLCYSHVKYTYFCFCKTKSTQYVFFENKHFRKFVEHKHIVQAWLQLILNFSHTFFKLNNPNDISLVIGRGLLGIHRFFSLYSHTSESNSFVFSIPNHPFGYWQHAPLHNGLNSPRRFTNLLSVG